MGICDQSMHFLPWSLCALFQGCHVGAWMGSPWSDPPLSLAIPRHVIALTTSAFPAFHFDVGATPGSDGAILVGTNELGVNGWVRETALFPHTVC
jgi:hypothetical protein